MNASQVAQPRGVLWWSRGERGFTLERLPPSAGLEGWVEHFWCVQWDLRGRPARVSETLPHPSVNLSIETRRAEVVGVVTGRYTRRLSGRGRVVAVKFRPAMFQPFLRRPLSTLTDRVVSPEVLFGPDARELARRVRAERDVRRCAALLEGFLLERLPSPSAPALRVRDLVERLAADRTLVRAEQVAALAGVDLRRLQRLFRTYAGVSPKWVLQRFRLHEAAEALDAGASGGLGALALRLGYFDQAHFIRDFRAVVGCSPGAYLHAGPR